MNGKEPKLFDSESKYSDSEFWDDFLMRRVEKKDLRTIVKIQNRCFPIVYREEFYKNLITNWNVFSIVTVRIGTGEIAGVASVRVEKLDGYFDFFLEKPPRRRGYIMTLAVLPEYRRNGIARRMMEYCEEEFTEKYDVNCFMLHTECVNEKAIKFYKSIGYEIEKRLTDFYLINKIKSDAYVFKKVIKEAKYPSLKKHFLRYILVAGFACLAFYAVVILFIILYYFF